MSTTKMLFCAIAVVACLFASSQSRASNGGTAGEQSHDLPAANSVHLAKATGPIKDSTDRIRYIIDLIDDHTDKPARFNGADHKLTYHKAKSAQLIDVSKLRRDETIRHHQSGRHQLYGLPHRETN